MYLNRRSCTASKAQLQSEKEKGEKWWKEESLGDVELLPCLLAWKGRAFLLPYHQDNYEVVARVVSLLRRTKTGLENTELNLFNHPFSAKTPLLDLACHATTFQWGRAAQWERRGKVGKTVGYLRAQSCTMSDLERTMFTMNAK